MRRLLFVAIWLLAAACSSSALQTKPPEPAAALAPPAPPSRYKVVYRSRSALRDPAFASIERRGEYVLEEVNHSRSRIWEGRDSLQQFWQRP